MALTFPATVGKSQTEPVSSFSAVPTKNFLPAPDAGSKSRLFADVLAASQVQPGMAGSVATDGQPDLATSNKDTEDQFMSLLVAQMRNQDPLNPLDNAQVTTQLAQINTVRGIDELNKKLVTLTNQFSTSNPADSAAMIGKSVLVAGDRLKLGAGVDAAVNGAGEFSLPTANAQVEIFGADSKIVRTIALGAQPAGLTTFEWDGRSDSGSDLPAGEYGFRVLAQGDSGPVAAAPFAAARVTGITRAGEGISLRLEEGATVPAESIRGVF